MNVHKSKHQLLIFSDDAHTLFMISDNNSNPGIRNTVEELKKIDPEDLTKSLRTIVYRLLTLLEEDISETVSLRQKNKLPLE